VLEEDQQTSAFQLLAMDGTTDQTAVFAQIPAEANLEFISASALHPNNSQYYLVASTKVNTSSPDYKVFTFSSAGALLKTSGVVPLPGTSFIIRVGFDTVSGKLFGIAEEWQGNLLRYAMAEIDPTTGQSRLLPIASITDGIVTAVTYSASQRSLFFCEARNGFGGVLHKVSVETGKEVTVPVQSGYVVESLEASS